MPFSTFPSVASSLRRFVALFILLPFLPACTPSTRPVTIPIWQDCVEEYVQKEANGDPAALRDVTWRGDEKGFAVIGTAVPSKSTDANGLLLAHRQIAGHGWFIYLVGLVEKEAVTDIRLAAVRFDKGKAVWRLSRRDPAALQAYRSYRQSSWRTLYPGRQQPPVGYLSFPRPEDRFNLTVSADDIEVAHEQSSARWRLDLEPRSEPEP